MVNVRSKRCRYDGCIKWPVFNKKGERSGLYCNSHKQPDMVNVIDECCQADGCIKQASFGTEGQSTRQFCASHSQPGMDYKKRRRLSSYIVEDVIAKPDLQQE